MVGRLMLFKMLHCKHKGDRKTCVEKHQERMKRCRRYSARSIKSEVQDYRNACRVCLINEGDVAIHGDESYTDKAQYLIEFGGIDVKIDDGFSQYLCKQCNKILECAIQFRKTAQKSAIILKGSKQETVYEEQSIKNETMTSSEDEFDADDSVDLKSLSLRADIIENIERAKKLKSTYFCVRCDIEFKTQDELAEHRMSDEHENKRVNCPICNQDFKYTSLKSHMLRHETSSICDICGKECKGQVDRHRQTHFYDLPFKCMLCPYRGRSTESVKVHMRSHTALNMKVKNYHCPQCPSRSFINKSNLTRHMLTHKTSRDFKCEMCDRGFHMKRDLEMHLKVDHTGLREYGCETCGKLFGYKKQLRQHQRKVHKREKLKSGRTPLYVLAEQGGQSILNVPELHT